MYVHRILSLLTWFPEFTAKHGFRYRRILLVLLFQPAICYTDNVSPQNCPFTRDLDSGPLSSTWFLGPTRVHTPKRHLDRFSRFCTAQGCNHRPTNGQTDRQTDRQTDHATPSATIGRIYIVVRCGLIISCAILKRQMELTLDGWY